MPKKTTDYDIADQHNQALAVLGPQVDFDIWDDILNAGVNPPVTGADPLFPILYSLRNVDANHAVTGRGGEQLRYLIVPGV